jgi:hypothetical protein
MDQFGGIPVNDDESVDQFGGIPISDVLEDPKSVPEPDSDPGPEGGAIPLQEKMEWIDVIKSAIKNSPKSGSEYLKNTVTGMYDVITNPKKAADPIGKVIAGGLIKYLDVDTPTPETDAFIDFFKSKYGSIESAKKTLSEDPFQVFSDLSLPVQGAGKLANLSGKVAKLGSKVGTAVKSAGTSLSDASSVMAGAPGIKNAAARSSLSGLGKAAQSVGKVVESVGKSAGRGLQKGGTFLDKLGLHMEPMMATGSAIDTYAAKYQESAFRKLVKFSEDYDFPTQEKFIKLALKLGVTPSAKGLQKLQGQIDKVNVKIGKLIDRGVAEGKVIKVSDLWKDLNKFKKELMKSSLNPVEVQNTVDKVRKGLAQYNKDIRRKTLTPQEAQDYKLSIYQEFESAYAKMMQSPVKSKVAREIASNMKNSLEYIFPGEMAHLNKMHSERKKLMKALKSAAYSTENQNMVPFYVKVMGATAIGNYMMGGQGAAGFGATAAVLTAMESRKFKAAMIHYGNALRKAGHALSPAFRTFIHTAPLEDRLKGDDRKSFSLQDLAQPYPGPVGE